jgi:protein-S-isoprenylcysteine O-methyltransferase Ste14
VLVALGNFFFKYRDLLVPVVFVALIVLLKPRPLVGRRYWPDYVAGIAMILAGLGLRAAVVGFAYIKRGGKDKQVYADELVTGGLFAHSRNPLYVGNFLAAVGLLVVHGNPWAIGLGTAFFALLFLSITAAEETFLHGKFGEPYDDYCRRVNRFVPNFRGVRASTADMTYDWPRLLRKEYGTWFLYYSAVLGMIAYAEIVRLSRAGTLNDASRIAVTDPVLLVWLPGVIVWILLRVLKKRGTLGRDDDVDRS